MSSGALLLQQLGGWYHAMVQVCPLPTLATLATYRGDMQCVPHQGGSLSVASTWLNHPEFMSYFGVIFVFAHFWRVAHKTGGFVISRLPPRPQSDSAVCFANNENYNCTIAKSPHHFQVSLWRDNQQSFRIRKYVDFTVSTKNRILA